MACHQRLRTAHKEGQRRTWHAIISFGQHRRSDDVWSSIPSPPLDSTHGLMTSGVACHHCPWTAHTVGRRRAWYEIIALGLHAWTNYVGHGMTSPPLDNTHGRTTRSMACHHRPWTGNTVEQRRAWHAIIAFGQPTRSNGVGHGMPSLPFGSTPDHTT